MEHYLSHRSRQAAQNSAAFIVFIIHPVNRVASTTQRLNGVTHYEYDTNDRIVKVIAPNGVTTNYEYDLLGRVTKEISPDRGTSLYTYDLANNVTTVTDGRGITAPLTYDVLERVTAKAYPNTIVGKNENVSYGYDVCPFGVGKVCAKIDESGSTTYAYDAFGNLTQQTFTERAGTVYTQRYEYDNSDFMTQVTYPDGRVIHYTRDGVRRVAAIDTTVNGQPHTVLSAMRYRGDGQIAQYTLGNGLVDERNYDLQGRLTHQVLRDATGTLTLDERSYSYDKNSNLLNIDTNTEDHAYAYDPQDRVTSETLDANTPVNYTYDLNDNRQTQALADLTLQDTFDGVANTNRLATYDSLQTGATPLPNIPNRDLVYNDAGRLYQLLEEGTLKTEYIYNDAGQRTRKIVHHPDTTTSTIIYHHDLLGNLISETDETGRLIRDYIWMAGPVAQIDSTGTSESLVYLHADHLQTSRLATDAFQSIVWRWEGDVFGDTPAEELGGISINLRYPGQYYDQETGLHYNMFRDYDPSTGRYVESDPIGLNGGLNTYSYVLSNPVSNIDPSGLDCFAWDGQVHCSVPHSGISINPFPQEPNWWPNSISPGDSNYHHYDKTVSFDPGKVSTQCLRDYLREHPTPFGDNQNPAMASGSLNYAMYGGNGPFNPVQSYWQSTNGGMVVNVTHTLHALGPGYVARWVENGAIHNSGEGVGSVQDPNAIYAPFVDKDINDAWIDASQAAINYCSCQK
jgi:RHS repeat-associated protein